MQTLQDTALAADIRAQAWGCGFDLCRFAKARRATHADAYLEWIAQGQHGDMAWMERHQDRRCDPREVLPGCATVICLGLNYFPGESPGHDDYRIARYAWNDDYHDGIGERLKKLDAYLQTLGGTQRYYVDTGPVLERDFATDAGLGWNGKSSLQIHRQFGTWLFLAEILTTLTIPADEPFGDHCGKCTRCIDACPTQAIVSPHRVDARRCISYLTIENKESIPIEFRRAIGHRIYGCDDCLTACPWNRFAQISNEIQFHAREEIFRHSLRDFLSFDDETFRRVFAKSPIKRIKRHRFLRNVCVALGNTGTPDDLPALQRAAQDEDPLIAEHASWAVEEIQKRNPLSESNIA
jgi:epoxyqueuosine reductase